MASNQTNSIKLGNHPRIHCRIKDQECSCADGTCDNAILMLITCPVCNQTGAAFDCSKSGCPVNGGAP